MDYLLIELMVAIEQRMGRTEPVETGHGKSPAYLLLTFDTAQISKALISSAGRLIGAELRVKLNHSRKISYPI